MVILTNAFPDKRIPVRFFHFLYYNRKHSPPVGQKKGKKPMNKKEILEIKKQFTNENCAITRICGCYVDAEKQIRTELKEAFLSLPEEEVFKYFDIFRKTLSGTCGKNLISLDFPLDQEMPDGAQAWLLKLRDSRLTDDLLLEEFYV